MIKESQITETYNLGNQADEITIVANTQDFSQNIVYPFAPSSFELTVNIVHINIDFRTV